MQIIMMVEKAVKAYHEILNDNDHHFKNIISIDANMISIDAKFYNGPGESPFY